MLPDMGFNLFKGFIAEVMFDLTSVRRRGLWVNPQPNQKLSPVSYTHLLHGTTISWSTKTMNMLDILQEELSNKK